MGAADLEDGDTSAEGKGKEKQEGTYLEDGHIGPGRIAEVHIPQLDVSLARRRLLAGSVIDVDLGLALDGREHSVRSRLALGKGLHVRHGLAQRPARS